MTKQAIAKAPLRETIAAAMLIGSEWDMTRPLVDPMCGSGTIAIEGAMMARRMAPGVGRSFAFEQWPEHDSSKWNAMVDEARQAVRVRVSERNDLRPLRLRQGNNHLLDVGAVNQARQIVIRADVQYRLGEARQLLLSEEFAQAKAKYEKLIRSWPGTAVAASR